MTNTASPTSPEFLRAIAAQPDDDTTRLVYADWLDEHGDPDRARFIRIQIELARDIEPLAATPLKEDRRAELLAEADILWKDHSKQWDRPLLDLGAPLIVYRRGFPDELYMGATQFLANAKDIFDAAPVRRLMIQGLVVDRVRALAECPQLGNLTRLDLAFNAIDDEGARALAGSPHLRNLTHLILTRNAIGDEGARALAGSPHLRNLTQLSLWGNAIGPEGARALADSPHLSAEAKVSALESARFPALARQVPHGRAGRSHPGPGG